jgi:hypothetical protein
VVRGTDATPYVRATIAHELTHAIDDQHFELERPAIEESDGEEGFGFSALVEGNAVRVEEAYLDTLSAAERDQYADEEAELAEGFPQFSIPTAVIQTLIAPYVTGPVLVDHILEEGGQPRLDEAFAEPPITSEQVLEPEVFIDGEGPRAVTPPTADGAVASQGAFGAFLLGLVLRDEISGSDAREAVDGWGGDAYVAWADGDRSCIRASFVGDSEDDTGEIASALEAWAEETEAEVSSGGGDAVTVTRCG